MRLPSSERSLRRLVAQLAAAAPDDIEAVLAELDDDQRARIHELLKSYEGQGASPASPRPSTTTLSTEGLSGWLALRVRDLGSASHGGLTAAAAQALREVAGAASFKRDAPSSAPRSWLSRLAPGGERP